MNRTMITRMFAAACGAVLMLSVLAGCMSPNTGATDQQQANRTYMTKVNLAMEALNERLASFNDAVSRGDAVTMRTQADNAYKAIDELSAIDTPDVMADLQKNYVDGCNTLKDALNAYVDLYTEISAATDEHPFDYATYDDRIKAVQDTYNKGIDQLKAADEQALKLNED